MRRNTASRVIISPRRGLNRAEAAAYVGVSPGTFDGMVNDGRMPEAKRVNTRKIWDLLELDEAFADLPKNGSSRPNTWDEVGA